MLELIDPTPQRVGGRRRHLTTRGARRSLHREVTAHHAALQSPAFVTQPTNLAVMAAARTQLGKPYCLYGCRCSDCPCRDCSGEICYALNKAGYPPICTSSFGFAQMAQDYELIIPKAQALLTPGAIGIRCPFCDPNHNGSNGHVWFCAGDGHSSVEEGGHRTGCYIGNADKPGDVIYALIPGVLYVPERIEEIDMFVQYSHYDANGKVTGPAKPPPGDGGDPIVCVAADGKSIEARHGASIANDKPADPSKPLGLRRWTSPANPLPAGATFTGVAARNPDAIDARPGGVALVSDGTTRRFHLS